LRERDRVTVNVDGAPDLADASTFTVI